MSVWRLAADRLSASPHESLTLPGGDRSHVRGISIDRQGRLVAGNFAGQVVHQQLEPWSTLWTKETGLRLDGAATTPDGLRVCVVGNEAPWVARAVCFRTQDGERVPLNELFAGGVQFPSNAFRSMVITPDGRWLIGGGMYLVQLDLVGESPATLIAPSASVISPLNISISGDASSILWPLNGLHRFSLLSGHFVPTPPEAGEERIRPLFRSPPTLSVDRRFIAVEGVRARIGSDGRATDVRPSSTGGEINVGVLLLNAEDNRLVAELDVVTEDAVPTFAADGSVLVWRSRQGIGVVDLPCVCNRRDIAVALDSLVYVDLAVDPQGDWVAVPIDRGLVGVYSLTSGTLTHRLDSLKGATIRRLAFVPSSADALSLAIGTDEGDVYVWNESRVAHVELSRSPVTALDVARDASQIVVGKENGDLAIINAATGAVAHAIPAAHAGTISAVRFGYGPWICSAGWDGTFRFWRQKTAERIGTLAFSLQGGALSWAFVSQQGRFEGEPRAFASILWRFSERLDDVMPVEAFTQDFYRQGVLREVLESARIPPAPKVLSAVDRRVAVLSLETEPDGREIIETRTVKARIGITHLPDRATELRDVKLFRDGVLVKQWHGVIPKSTTELSVDVPIVGGLNELQAYGFNGDRVKSLDATNGVVGARALDRAGTVYVLSIGVNSYDRSIGSLRYSENDARAFARAIQTSQSTRAIRPAVLVDRDATRENILCALKRLGATGVPPTCRVEQLSELMPVAPFDSVFVFFSGHANSTIMPGLIDAHAHVASLADPRQALQFGVTTVLDMGAANVPQEQVFEVRAAARTATDMAEVFSAGFLASSRRPAGSTRPVVTSVDDAVRFADARRADGADYLKLQLNGARSALSRVVMISHSPAGVADLHRLRAEADSNARRPANHSNASQVPLPS